MANDSLQYVITEIAQPVDLTELHALDTKRYPFLLESTAQATTSSHTSARQHARYNMLFACPQGRLTLHNSHQLSSDRFTLTENDFITEFNKLWKAESIFIHAEDTLGSFLGWFVYLSYEFAEIIEPSLVLAKSETDVLAEATRIPIVIVEDKQTNKTRILCENSYVELMDQVMHDITNCSKGATNVQQSNPFNLNLTEQPADEYIHGIKRIKEYIYAGDVFQVNYSRLWKAQVTEDTDSVDLYRRLKTTNPAPFSGIAVYPTFTIISSSPERLVKVRGNTIQSRPIAGTRPRLLDDEETLKELIEHPKERAEHIMLIDLERNDLGRVCLPGSVVVTELMVLESFAHVHHIVSNVEGTLQPDVHPGDVIKAVFPGGTITGCPKVRCMEIIAELEQQPRNAYTGSMGYIGHNGNMDLNILIRTMLFMNDTLQIRAGAGIVYDSIAENELDETRAKAKGMIMGLAN